MARQYYTIEDFDRMKFDPEDINKPDTPLYQASKFMCITEDEIGKFLEKVETLHRNVEDSSLTSACSTYGEWYRTFIVPFEDLVDSIGNTLPQSIDEAMDRYGDL